MGAGDSGESFGEAGEKLMKLSVITAACVLVMQPITATDVGERYTVTLEVWAPNSKALCNRAWQLALREHSRDQVEAMMTLMGDQPVSMCVATAVKMAMPAELEVVGIEVRK